MKTLILGFLITMALAASAGAQTKAPDQAAKEFYKWYLTELNAERYPIRQNKPRMLRAVSKRLGQWIYSPAYSEYGADYFIDAQDWERTWVSGISATRPVVNGTTATLSIKLEPAKGVYSGFGRRTLAVKMVKEAGSWKMDNINNRKLTK